ncbi:hypothetical protein Tco_0134653 [Tanacetum coccineum]
MDDLNITIEEYIRLEEEKARRHGRTFNWKTTTFGKVENYEDEDDCFINFETEFPAIVFVNTLTAISFEVTVYPPNENEIDFRISLDESDDEDYMVFFDENSFSYKMISVNDLKKDSKNDNNDMPTVDYIDDLDFFKEYENEFPAINVLYFNDLFNIIHPDDLKSEKDNDDNDIDIIQSSEGIDPRDEARFDNEVQDGIYWREAVGVHKSCLEENIWDPSTFGLRVYPGVPRHLQDERLCHKMIAYSISGRGQASEKVISVDLFYLRSMDQFVKHQSPISFQPAEKPHNVVTLLVRYKGRKNRARLSGGNFIRRSAMHFRLVSDEGLRGLLAWVAQGPERQHATTTGAHKADEAGPATEEATSEIPAPAQAPPPPPPTLQPRTMSQRIERIEEELMDASGQTYQPFDSTLVGSLRFSFQRCVRPRTSNASTSAAPHTDAQLDP